MKNRDVFSSYHPIVNFVYFALVLTFTMVFMHPALLACSLICAAAYAIYLNGRKAVRFMLLYLLPMMLLTAALNPAFNHKGATILTYLSSGNPLTLESLVYGFAAAAMLAAVICWFSCYNAVMSSDKFVYLFGRIIPGMSLVLSMTLRFVPKFKAQFKAVSDAQKCLGVRATKSGACPPISRGLKVLSVMVTWALENAIETADSMKSRGYGLKGRTAYSIYHFDSRDRTALAVLLLFGAYILAGSFLKLTYWRYFPIIKGANLQAASASVFAAYFALCSMPLAINRREDRKWKRSKSKI